MIKITTLLVAIISAAAAVLASTGFWAYVTKRVDHNNAEKKLLLGLAHDRLIDLSTKYIHRGFISHEELEDLHHYLYEPYRAKGGNGTVEKMMRKVDELPVKSVSDIYKSKECLYNMKPFKDD